MWCKVTRANNHTTKTRIIAFLVQRLANILNYEFYSLKIGQMIPKNHIFMGSLIDRSLDIAMKLRNDNSISKIF